MGNIGDKVLEIVNDEIFHNQIAGFSDTLYDMKEMIARLAYEQNNVADTINEQYRDLNYDLFWEAINYLDIAQPEKVYTARIVGQEMLAFTTTELIQGQIQTLSKLLNEKISIHTVKDEEYWDGIWTTIEDDISGEGVYTAEMERDWGKIMIVHIPKENNIIDEHIQMIEQIFESPIVRV